ncbi:MAG: hypothetical protein ACRDT4_03810 [Micromonosporaceae bacterium]
MTGPQQPPYGGQGGQWPAGGGDWQNPADQTQYSGPSDPGGPPGYEQPQQYESYEQPQQYDQFGQQPPQQGFSDQYSAPPAYSEPYSAPPNYADPNAPGAMPPPPPSKGGGATPWIIGGVAGVVVLVLVIVVGALLLNRGSGGGGGPSGGGTTSAGTEGGGKYSAEAVKDACELVDKDSLKKWADTAEEEPEHSENKSEYSSYLNCSFSLKGGEYERARMYMYTTIGGKSTNVKDSYDREVKSAKGSTGSGKENGEVDGVGASAYFSSTENSYSDSSSYMYDLIVLDDNILVRISISLFVDGSIDKAEVQEVAKKNAEKVMEGCKA